MTKPAPITPAAPAPDWIVEEGDLLRSPRSGTLYRVIYLDPSQTPGVAVVECGGLGAPLVNAPVRYIYPERFDREH